MELIVLTILIVLGILIVAYIFLAFPNTSRKSKLKPFENVLIAHRGLYDNQKDAPENSMASFRKALEAGYGIEMDVQRTADGQLVVFHDFLLKRMTGGDHLLTGCTFRELQQYTLGVSKERIPLFSDVLKLVDGRVPLVIEIKVGMDYRKTTEAVYEMLKNYEGIYCIECFNPMALRWYRKRNPEVLRGQLSTNFFRDDAKMPAIARFAMSHLLVNWISRPDFISYNHKFQKKKSFRVIRKIFRAKTAAWTIKSQEELEKARKRFDVFIFDSFKPDDKKNDR